MADMADLAGVSRRTLPRPYWTEALEYARLSPFERVLLVTDGTVTNILRAYADEPIVVEKLSQAWTSSDSDLPELELGPNESLIQRRILLRGEADGRTFVCARSLIATDRLPPSVREGLLTTNRPIGELLQETRLETFREILEVGQEPAGETALHFDLEPDAPMIFRRYRIVSSQRPIMVIREDFPAGWFQSLQ